MSTNVTLPSAPAIEAQALSRHRAHVPAEDSPGGGLDPRPARRGCLQILRYTKKRAARDIEKVLRSAIANAERKAEDAGASLDVDELYVSRCFVNEGSRWKRLRPAPMGRAFRYQRRTAHIVVAVAEHHRAAAERTAAAVAAAASEKGVRGAVKKARKALGGGKQAPARKPKKQE